MSEPDGSDATADEDDAPADDAPADTVAGDTAAGEEADAEDGYADNDDRGDTLEDIAAEPTGDAAERLREIAAESVAVPEDVDLAETDLAAVATDLGETGEAAFAPAELEVDEELVDRVAEADPEAVAVELATLQLRVAALAGETTELASEVEDLESRLARKQADFQNYKQRQQRKLEQEKARATEDLVERLLDVRDNLQRALDQDEDADIRGGVESTLRQFDEQLARENVERIEPDPGEETDPQRHEVLMRVESDEPADSVAHVHRPGYEMGGKVLRAAQVTVSEGPGDEREGADGDTADASEEAPTGTDGVD